MKITSVRHIEGPNVYIYRPVLVAMVDLEELTEKESHEVPGFVDTLLSHYPGLEEHHCAKGRPGGFVERLRGGTYFGHIVEHLAIEMASNLGLDVHYGKTLYAGTRGKYEIVIECEEYECQKQLLSDAIQVIESLLQQKSLSPEATLQKAGQLLAKTQLGPSTAAIVEAARRRNIPVRRLNQGSLVQLGYGANRRLVQATMNEHTSAVSVDIAGDKQMTKQLLYEAGLPVPEGGVADSENDAVAWFTEIGQPVVVKPLNGNQGKGVSMNLVSEEEVRQAYRLASTISKEVVVESYVAGKNIRLLVVNGKLAAASQRIPAHVAGDGTHTIQELVGIENQNPLRGDDHELPLTRIRLDETAMRVLSQQGLGITSIPLPKQTVYLRDSANLSTGGEAIDITSTLHPRYRMIAERAARIIGLNICGIDMIVQDPNCEDEKAVVIEANAAPGIRMHQHPSYGLSRNVGESIIDGLYPNGENGRIPIISVTGTNGKTTTTRLIAHILSESGYRVGLTTTSGVYVNNEKILDGDTTGPQSAKMVLSDPAVEAAVLETARGGILRGGLAYDKANVAVLTNITPDHVGQDFVETLDDLVHIKSLVAECVADDGTIVLNADNAPLVDLGRRLRGKVSYFSVHEENPVLQQHLAEGGVGHWVSDGWIMEGRGNLRWKVADIAEIPLTMQGTARFQIENCLAAASALRSLGTTRRELRNAFATFLPATENPGRCSIYRMPNGSHVVLDYGHNPDGYRRVGEWLRQASIGRLFGVVGVPGDRTDNLVRETAREAARVFDYFVVKEDADKRGRSEGEIASIMSDEIRQSAPNKPLQTVLDESEALWTAISLMKPDDTTVVFYEKLAPLQSLIEKLQGQPADALRKTETESAMVMR